MKDTRFIKTIRLKNLLSFGPDSEEIELKPLNVLIGPNASGKSNFIEAFDLLRATTFDINTPMRYGGGSKEWIWKGNKDKNSVEIEAKILHVPGLLYEEISLRYLLAFSILGENLFINEEIIESENPKNDEDFFYRNKNGKVVIKVRQYKGASSPIDQIQTLDSTKGFNAFQSILSQREDPFSYPQLTSLKQKLREIKLYRNWYVGSQSTIRMPQQPDLPSGFLSENLNNLALVVNDLESRQETRGLIADKLKLFYNDVNYITPKVVGGPIQIFISEKGLNELIPATRLSDGTLRYLCLLTILCHPERPPLICIEEPEIGLHPDIMPTIADLLIEASKWTQLIVTTHSDVLVSALSETPESVLVCEHDEAGTHLRRLEEKKLKVWLEKYSLGELWTMGEIGGTRW